MNVNQDLSFVSLITNASLLAQLIMLILLIISIVSWAFIFQKMLSIKKAKKQTEQFEKTFWSGGNLMTLFQEISAGKRSHPEDEGPLERIFYAGMNEFLKSKNAMTNKGLSSPELLLDGSRRSMRAAYQREMDALETNLPFLASVGSVSPYIGLFGTVWGIISAFRGLANVQQATLAAVAPGIAEALIATAFGLFAAIPAVIAYNRYTNSVDRLSMEFETFVEEFSNILQRQAR